MLSMNRAFVLGNGEINGYESLFRLNVFAARNNQPAADTVGQRGDSQIGDLQEAEKAVVETKIRLRSLGDVIFDERPTTGPENVIIDAVDLPIEMRTTPLKKKGKKSINLFFSSLRYFF